MRTLQEPGSRGRGRPTERDGRARGQKRKVRGARDAIPNPKWSWILWILCLWRALQMGAALVLKGNRVEVEVFFFYALRCDNSHALASY